MIYCHFYDIIDSRIANILIYIIYIISIHNNVIIKHILTIIDKLTNDF